MEWKSKPWGSYRIVHSGDDEITVVNRIDKGGFCSVHSHERHSNTFLVEKGVVHVAMYTPGGVCKQVQQVQEGRGFVVSPGDWHQFYAKEDSLVWEWYVQFKRDPNILQFASLNDIVRREGLHFGGIRMDYPYANVPHVWS